eukprot:1946705-Lingulodinium_polyedra.AAC.1
MQSGNMRSEGRCCLKASTAGRASQLRALKGLRRRRLRKRLGSNTGPNATPAKTVLRKEADDRAPALNPVPQVVDDG